MALLATTAGAVAQVAAPAAFVENRGQWHAQARYRSGHGGTTAWFDANGWTLVHVVRGGRAARGREPNEPKPANEPLAQPFDARGVAVRFALPAHEGELHAEVEVPGLHHFLRGLEAKGFVTGARGFARLRYTKVLPGVDLVVRADAGEGAVFAWDLECQAGAAARAGALVIRVEGGEGELHLGAGGALRLATAAGVLEQSAPVAWQAGRDGVRRAVECGFRVLDVRTFGFAVGATDPDLPLVVDPALRWSTFAGGTAFDVLHDVAVGPGGVITAAGLSDGTDYPTSIGAFQPMSAGNGDAVVTQLDPTANGALQLRWSTYLGGSLEDDAFGVAVDAAGFVTVTGYTFSNDFPVTGASTFGGGQMDAFVTRLLPGGNALVHSTYVGGSGDDWGCRVVADGALGAVVVGYTGSSTYATTPNAYDGTWNGQTDMFVRRNDTSGSVTWSTFFGGSSYEGFLFTNWQNYPVNIRTADVAVDGSGRVLVAGYTASTDLPTTPGAFGGSLFGAQDAFVALLDPAQSGAAQLRWSTYYGGSGSDGAMGVGFGPAGSNVVVACGYTYSAGFPVTAGALLNRIVGQDEAWCAILDPSLSGPAQLVYATLHGGTEWDGAYDVHLDPRGWIVWGGFVGPGAVTTPGALQTSFGGVQDAWVAKVRPGAPGQSLLVHCTQVGGDGYDLANGIASDGMGGVWLAGSSASAAWPVAGNPFQSTLGGRTDGVVARLDLLPVAVDRFAPGSSPHCQGEIVFEVDRLPAPAQTFAFLIGGAPPNAPGALALGTALHAPPVPLAGAQVCTTPLLAVPLASDAAGSVALPIAVQPFWVLPCGIVAQPLFASPSCPQPLTSGAALRM